MVETPDANGVGLATAPLNALRYDGHTDDPDESAGILRSFMPENVRVLDVGCGTGSVSVIANQGKHNVVFGIEPDSERAAVAKSRGVEVTCGYLTAEYLAEHGAFDVVMFADVLEHVPNPAAMLALANSGLKTGGWLLISVPNAVHWTMRWHLLAGKFEYTEFGIRDSTHLRWFTGATISRLVDQTGFDTVGIRSSAGMGLPEYTWSRPWRWLKFSTRARIVRKLAKKFPSVFGCQYLIKARKR